jgi:hypothetical protein
MQHIPCRIGITALLVVLFLVLPALADRSDAQVLRYHVRADPFEVQLTLPDGTKQTAQLRREATHFYFLGEQGLAGAGRSQRQARTLRHPLGRIPNRLALGE